MRAYFLVIALAIFISCQEKRSYAFEEDLMSCFYQQYADYGIDVKPSIDSARDILIRSGIISDRSGTSYIDFLLRLAENPRDALSISDELLLELKSISYLPSSIGCQDTAYFEYDSAVYEQSKFKYTIGIYDSLANYGDLSSQAISREVLKVFDAQDFEHEFYNTAAVIILSNYVKVLDQLGSLNGLPTLPPQRIPANESSNIKRLQLTHDDKIIIDEQETDIKSALEEIKVFILEEKSAHIISVQTDRSTSYDLYIKAIDGIVEIYTAIWNEKAQTLFGQTYDQLPDSLQATIKEIYPRKISLPDPTNRAPTN